MKVNLQWATPDAEYNMAYCARVSSIKNQDNKEFRKLFEYCLNNGHWSVFQMSSMCLSIETSLAISMQFMRHWSLQIHEPLDVQMLSQRYTDPLAHGLGFQPIELRKQAKSNRQSSEDVLSGKESEEANQIVRETLDRISSAHESLIQLGVANECCRMLLPQATTTRFFVVGSCRSWVHYLNQRLDEHTQKEHQELANKILDIFKEQFPTVYDVLYSSQQK